MATIKKLEIKNSCITGTCYYQHPLTGETFTDCDTCECLSIRFSKTLDGLNVITMPDQTLQDLIDLLNRSFVKI